MTKQSRALALLADIERTVSEFTTFVASCVPSVNAEDVRRPNDGVFLRYLDLLEARIDAENAGRKCLNLDREFKGSCIPQLRALAEETPRYN